MVSSPWEASSFSGGSRLSTLWQRSSDWYFVLCSLGSSALAVFIHSECRMAIKLNVFSYPLSRLCLGIVLCNVLADRLKTLLQLQRKLLLHARFCPRQPLGLYLVVYEDYQQVLLRTCTVPVILVRIIWSYYWWILQSRDGKYPDVDTWNVAW
jgi:hypothetical protein